MCSFLRGFMLPLFSDLSKCLSSEDYSVRLCDQSRKDLRIWNNFLQDGAENLPICRRYYNPPLSYKSFSSDAAGCRGVPAEGDLIGCDSVGFNRQGHIIMAYQLFWPPKIIGLYKDPLGHWLGNKTTTLEFLGILLPFLLIPHLLSNQVVEVKVDNVGCYYGWLNRLASSDVMASVLIRALHLISSYLACQVHNAHHPSTAQILMGCGTGGQAVQVLDNYSKRPEVAGLLP